MRLLTCLPLGLPQLPRVTCSLGLLFLLRNGDADAPSSGLLGNERNGRVRGSQETKPQCVCGVIESPDVPGGTEDTYASLAGSQGR